MNKYVSDTLKSTIVVDATEFDTILQLNVIQRVFRRYYCIKLLKFFSLELIQSRLFQLYLIQSRLFCKSELIQNRLFQL